MALIDFVSWKPDGGEFVFAYHFPENNLSTYTQLVVYESQEALLFSKGQLLQRFGAGKHKLDTENIPLLRNLFGLPFGGKNPFVAEVWFVNKLYPANLAWGVTRMAIHDVDYQTMIPLRAAGQYGLSVEDSAKFLLKMVGTKTTFTERDMLDQAYGELATKIKSFIVQFMTTQRIGYKSISAHLDQLSEYIKQSLLPFWEEYGLKMTKFYITDITIDTSTPEGQKVSEAIASQASMSITGHSWQQEQMFDMANSAVDQIGGGGSGGGLLASVMAMNMMNSAMGSGVGAGMMQANYNQPTFNSQQPTGYGQPQGVAAAPQAERMVYCAQCAKKHLTTERFCPHCGNEYRPCPSCGADNLKGARRCVSCGAPLQGGSTSTCGSCGGELPPGTAFCPHCGAPQQTVGGACPRCGTPITGSVKFCQRCGQKL